ncbi:ABC transporter permease [Pengzhenrongella frigida]|uniref:Transport permease protein n=1 Tax=Pengzhenrongella frigida TaxID=1259133 RepID=A0A4Q5N385_9MICO|nr:ABC transporter permease [Cellulomonas sp. HLT2-17]RYV51067.1 ABC transporter permease [Cellulomonas sp. HLT2-17]
MTTSTDRVGPGSTTLPSTLALGLARVGLEMRQFFRERDAVVFIFAYPVIMLGIFATVFGQDGGTVGPPPGIPFAQYFLPGMIATGVMLSSFQNLATSIAVERDDGALKRLRGTPMPATSYFLGKIGQVLVTSLVQTALLLVVAATLFDVPMPTTASAWATFAWVFLLGTATGCVCGIGFSSVPRSGKSASAVVVPVVLILQFISGVFFQYDSLPTWMQNLAAVFPLKWIAQGMRSAFFPASAEAGEVGGSWQHPATAAVLIVWLVVGLVVGVRKFRWQRRDDS